MKRATRKRLWISGACLIVCFWAVVAHSSLVIPVYSTGTGAMMGEIKADDTIYGLILTPHIHGLRPGMHGFHVDTCPMCAAHGLAAGGHWDPQLTDTHSGPYRGSGHLGDLPVLVVDRMGNATLPVLAPRLKLDAIKNRALVIDSGGDNYSDQPNRSGGGGFRIACGVIPYFN